jgi:hypothetical protein
VLIGLTSGVEGIVAPIDNAAKRLMPDVICINFILSLEKTI